MLFNVHAFIPLIVTPLFLILVRKDLLFFSFFSVFYIQYYFAPFFLINEPGYMASSEYFEMAFFYWISLVLGYFVLCFWIPNHKITQVQRKLDFYFIFYFAFGFGLILKLLTSSFFHTSISGSYNFDYWYLFGIADKLFYLGTSALIAIICLYPSKKLLIFFFILLFFLAFTGSRSIIILPLIMLFLLKYRELSILKSLWVYALLICLIALIIVAVGLYRVDEVGHDIPFAEYFDLFLFRFSEFIWTNKLIEVFPGPYDWNIFSNDLLGMFPSFISKNILGYSIFQIDTKTMLYLGIGQKTMSVPMGLIGQAYMASKLWGAVVSGITVSFIFTLIKIIIYKLSPFYKILVLLQLIRYSLVLPVGTLADVVAMGTKDLIVSILLILSFLLLRRLFYINSK